MWTRIATALHWKYSRPVIFFLGEYAANKNFISLQLIIYSLLCPCHKEEADKGSVPNIIKSQATTCPQHSVAQCRDTGKMKSIILRGGWGWRSGVLGLLPLLGQTWKLKWVEPAEVCTRGGDHILYYLGPWGTFLRKIDLLNILIAQQKDWKICHCQRYLN